METFNNQQAVYRLKCPENRTFVELRYAESRVLHVRVMRATKKGGEIRKTYFARFTNAQGKQVKEKIGDANDLTIARAILLTSEKLAKEQNISTFGEKSAPTLKSAFELYKMTRKESWRPATLNDYCQKFKHLEQYENKRIDELDTRFWESFYSEKAEKKPILANRVCGLVMALYEQEDLKNPFTKGTRDRVHKKPKAKTNSISEQKFKEFWEFLYLRANPATRDFALVIIFMGLRVSLVENLNWSRIDVQNRAYRIDEDDRGNKIIESAWLPIPQYIFDNIFMKRWQGQESGFVIESPKLKGKNLKNIKEFLNVASEKFGINITHHALRRTFSSNGYNATLDTLNVGSLMLHTVRAGNDNLEQTAKYVMEELEVLRRVSDKIEAYTLKLAGVE